MKNVPAPQQTYGRGNGATRPQGCRRLALEAQKKKISALKPVPQNSESPPATSAWLCVRGVRNSRHTFATNVIHVGGGK
jgi:hypothetical protein